MSECLNVRQGAIRYDTRMGKGVEGGGGKGQGARGKGQGARERRGRREEKGGEGAGAGAGAGERIREGERKGGESTQQRAASASAHINTLKHSLQYRAHNDGS
jgi:hypothetical protein